MFAVMTGARLDKQLKKIKTLAGRGELFAAVDAAENFITDYESNDEAPPLKLRHQAVLLKARAGSLNEAAARYKALGLDTDSDIDARSLGARLLKDMAYAGPRSQRTEMLRKSGQAYEEIYRDTGDNYPGINAATLAAFVGDAARAQDIAKAIITDITSQNIDPAKADYWHHATLAEANILAGAFDEAAQAIASAANCKETSLADKASTLKQLRRLLNVLDQPNDILKPLQPKPTIHYTGHMIAPPGKDGRIIAENEMMLRDRIEAAIDKINPGAAFGALASGADILIAERLLHRGADLHVVLPFAKDDFIDVSVSPADIGTANNVSWRARFDKCMAAASSITYLTDQPYMGDDILFGLGAKLAMGLALLHARHIAGSAEQLAIWDKKPTDFPAGTAVDIGEWESLGQAQHTVDVSDLGRTSAPPKKTAAPAKAQEITQNSRVDAAMLFGDFKGFSKLTDTQLPSYANDTLGLVANVLGASASGSDFINTWGDGLFAVWPAPSSAAISALDLQDSLRAKTEADPGNSSNLPIRISLHYGVTHRIFDPVLKKPNYFGEAVSRAARIEPITPTGAIYATEAFAAMLMLDSKCGAAAEYVGTIKVAKNYGAFPLYRIYRKNT